MNDVTVIAVNNAKATEKAKNTGLEAGKKLLRDVIVLSLWIYGVTKLFIFDVDNFVIQKFIPESQWILEYKFLFLTGTLSALWIFSSTWEMIGLFFYIFFFPFIVICWKIPSFLYKKGSWNMAIGALHAVASAFRSIKYNFITSTVFLISIATILASDDRGLLVAGAGALLVLTLMAYWRRFIFAFRPSTMHQMFMKAASGIRKHGASAFAIEEGMRSLTVQEFTSTQLTTWTNNLQMAVLFNRSCLFVARKLRDYEKTGIHVISFVLMILLLMLQTVVAFTGINYALFKIDPALFQAESTPTAFTFFFYSFNNMIFNSTPGLTAQAPISQVVYMAQTGLIFFLGAIFVSIIVSSMLQRHAQDLEDAISGIVAEGEAMEGFIRSEYRMASIDDAIVELQRLKGNMLTIILNLSNGIK